MIEFKNVGLTYPNGFTALKDINLKIEQGEFVAVIGLSGAGKSTLLRAINKMNPISKGSLLVYDKNISLLNGKDTRQLRNEVGMVFQSFNLIERVSVVKNVMLGNIYNKNWFSTLVGYNSEEEHIKAFECLDKVGIADKSFIRADQLSGGQRQRVALARTLMQDPKVILADEPVASLDPVFAKSVMDDFKKINVENNITVIANMHHVDLALEYATRVIGVNSGRIVFDGAVSEITDDILDKIYDGKISEDDILGA